MDMQHPRFGRGPWDWKGPWISPPTYTRRLVLNLVASAVCLLALVGVWALSGAARADGSWQSVLANPLTVSVICSAFWLSCVIVRVAACEAVYRLRCVVILPFLDGFAAPPDLER